MALLSWLPDLLAPELASLPGRGLLERLPGFPTKSVALGLAGLRSALFLAESLPLLVLQRLLSSDQELDPPPQAFRDALPGELRALIDRDAENIAAGLYPLSVLTGGAPLQHAFRYAQLLTDSVSVAFRRRDRRPREFDASAQRFLSEMPDYYQRNFHFQTDGYLSERSAELYEHQVEILFRGLGDAMRRMIIPPLSRHFAGSDGRGLHFLELAAGTGSATRFVAQAFPEAKITCLDLSPPYLKKARRRLADLDRVSFVQGDAAELDFRESRFDAVYSVFLFHEVPLAERRHVLSEARRVLKPGGFHGLIDSLQAGDKPELDWALDQFPKQFHEPYFRSYSRHAMEELVAQAGFDSPRISTGFLSKVVFC